MVHNDLPEVKTCDVARILQPTGRSPRREVEAHRDVQVACEQDPGLNGAKDARQGVVGRAFDTPAVRD
jgi:hypothetical protein